jgi:hypothetical protein
MSSESTLGDFSFKSALSCWASFRKQPSELNPVGNSRSKFSDLAGEITSFITIYIYIQKYQQISKLKKVSTQYF